MGLVGSRAVACRSWWEEVEEVSVVWFAVREREREGARSVRVDGNKRERERERDGCGVLGVRLVYVSE